MNHVIDYYYDLTMEDCLSAEEIAEILPPKKISVEKHAAFMDIASWEESCDV